MPSPLHPISIHRLERNKIYYVSHHNKAPRPAKILSDMHEELPGGVSPGGVMVVYSYEPYDAEFITEDSRVHKFYSKEAPRAPPPSPRRSSSRRRSSERRRATTRKAVSRVRRTKSAPRH